MIVINDRLQGLETPTIVGGSDIVGTPTRFVCLGVDIFLEEDCTQRVSNCVTVELKYYIFSELYFILLCKYCTFRSTLI